MHIRIGDGWLYSRMYFAPADTLQCYSCSYTVFSSDDSAGEQVAAGMNNGAAAINNIECKDSEDEFDPVRIVWRWLRYGSIQSLSISLNSTTLTWIIAKYDETFCV